MCAYPTIIFRPVTRTYTYFLFGLMTKSKVTDQPMSPGKKPLNTKRGIN